MTTATCIFGFQWTGVIVAEYKNTYVIECDETKTRQLIRKEKLSQSKSNQYQDQEAYGLFKTKEELLKRQKLASQFH